MKFLCPSCKAKYQIADEKVIGRSVKMKCRQCGHIIEIQESVVGASSGVSQAPIPLTSIPAPASLPPKPIADKGFERQQPSLGAGPASKAPVKPARPMGGYAEALGTKITGTAAPNRNLRPVGTTDGRIETSAGSGAAPRSHTPTPGLISPPAPGVSPSAGRGPVGDRTSPRPGAGRTAQGVSSALAPARSPVRNLGTPRHTATDNHPDTQHGIGQAAAERVPPAHVATKSEPTAAVTTVPRRTGEALAEAFTAAVGVDRHPSPDQFVGDEWYVGINDTPVGPIPLSELRSRAAQGQVTIESLVWRDGFEDWKPVRSFPELLAVIEEAISSVQASRVPVVPAVAPIDFGPPISLSAVQDRQPSAASALEAVAQSPAPQASAPLFVQVAAPALTPDEIAAATGRGVHRGPKGAWIAIGGALALGLSIGFVFNRQAPATTEIKYVPVAHSGSAAAVSVSSSPAASQDTLVVASAEEIHANVKRAASSDSRPSADGNGSPSASAGLKGLSGLRALGPQSGPTESGSTGGPSAGQALDSATLQKTVSRYTASVRRSCWQPALDSRAPDAPTVARVAVKIDIAAGGNVSAVSSNGDPRGYRGLASCIEGRVRNWSFPPSSGATTVNVPFVFAAQ